MEIEKLLTLTTHTTVDDKEYARVLVLEYSIETDTTQQRLKIYCDVYENDIEIASSSATIHQIKELKKFLNSLPDF